MRKAADAEDATDKSAISPGPIAPARELLGEMLLEAGNAKDALAAFEATMKKEPNRFRGAYGAARAAEAMGNQRRRGKVLPAGARDRERRRQPAAGVEEGEIVYELITQVPPCTGCTVRTRCTLLTDWRGVKITLAMPE